MIIAFNMEIINISKIDYYEYIVVRSTDSKIERLEKLCYEYMSPWDREYGIRDLKENLANGKLTQRKFDREMESIVERLSVSIIKPDSSIKLDPSELRDDKIKDIIGT
jgi:hypothetical protein